MITEINTAEILGSIYGIEGELSVQRITRGDWNHVFRVSAEHEWILRISHGRKTIKQLEFELMVLSNLENRLPYVPSIMKTISGQSYGFFQGQMCTLFESMPGSELSINDTTVKAAGATLAEIHNELSPLHETHRLIDSLSIINFDWFENYAYRGDVLDERILKVASSEEDEKYLPPIRQHIGFLRDTRTYLQGWLNDQTRSLAFTEGIVHGDFYKRNLLVTEEHISAVLDWDETATSWIEYEVANAAWEFARDDTHYRIDSRRWSLFLDSYTSKNSCCPIDSAAMSRLILVRRLIEIQLCLFEYLQKGSYDLAYCWKNVRYVENLMKSSV